MPKSNLILVLFLLNVGILEATHITNHLHTGQYRNYEHSQIEETPINKLSRQEASDESQVDQLPQLPNRRGEELADEAVSRPRIRRERIERAEQTGVSRDLEPIQEESRAAEADNTNKIEGPRRETGGLIRGDVSPRRVEPDLGQDKQEEVKTPKVPVQKQVTTETPSKVSNVPQAGPTITKSEKISTDVPIASVPSVRPVFLPKIEEAIKTNPVVTSVPNIKSVQSPKPQPKPPVKIQSAPAPVAVSVPLLPQSPPIAPTPPKQTIVQQPKAESAVKAQVQPEPVPMKTQPAPPVVSPPIAKPQPVTSVSTSTEKNVETVSNPVQKQPQPSIKSKLPEKQTKIETVTEPPKTESSKSQNTSVSTSSSSTSTKINSELESIQQKIKQLANTSKIATSNMLGGWDGTNIIGDQPRKNQQSQSQNTSEISGLSNSRRKIKMSVATLQPNQTVNMTDPNLSANWTELSGPANNNDQEVESSVSKWTVTSPSSNATENKKRSVQFRIVDEPVQAVTQDPHHHLLHRSRHLTRL